MALNLKEQEKLQYAILKNIADGNTKLPVKDFDVSQDDFGKAVKAMQVLGYLDGGDIYWNGLLEASEATITAEGKNFLYNNSKWGKALNLVKSIGDFVHSVKP